MSPIIHHRLCGSGLCSGHGHSGCQGSCGGSSHVVRQTEVLAGPFYITSAQNWIRNQSCDSWICLQVQQTRPVRLFLFQICLQIQQTQPVRLLKWEQVQLRRARVEWVSAGNVWLQTSLVYCTGRGIPMGFGRVFIWVRVRVGFLYPWASKRALDHPKQINIEGFMINLIVLLIADSILDCFGCSRACFNRKTRGFMGKTCHGYGCGYGQKYLGVTHAIH